MGSPHKGRADRAALERPDTDTKQATKEKSTVTALTEGEAGRYGGDKHLTPAGEEVLARIERAYKRFEALVANKYQPLLRVITGKSKLRVGIHPRQSSTDGKTMVFLKLPLELGDADVDNHRKEVCGLRGEDGLMICPACRILDEVDLVTFHEAFHMVFESFTDPGEKVKLAPEKPQ